MSRLDAYRAATGKRASSADDAQISEGFDVTRIYISGPMTGIEDFNFPAFHAAAVALRGMGYVVSSPAEVNPDTTMTWEQCLRADIKALCDCDVIALLPGWENSKGAHLEVHVAHRLGIRVAALHTLLLDQFEIAP